MIIVHATLAGLLFYVQNWIGGKSYSVGYTKFSLLDDKDDAVAVNYVIKVFTPVIFLIISVATFQYFNLRSINEKIINVIYLFIVFRILIIIVYERVLIVNWVRLFINYFSIYVLCTFIYNNFLLSISNLLPDFSQIKNEIWLIIIIFIYQAGNGFPNDASKGWLQEPVYGYLPELSSKKRKYIIRKWKRYTKKYGAQIDAISSRDINFKIVMISILIIENFNRPPVIRLIERLWFSVVRPGVMGTTGIMQVASHKILTDIESVKNGTSSLFDHYKEVIIEEKEVEFDPSPIRRTIKKHCKDKAYVRQVLFVSKAILDHFKSDGIDDDFKMLKSELRSEFALYDL